MTEVSKLLASDLEYVLVDPGDEQWHALAAQRGYYACNTEVLQDGTDLNECRDKAEITLNRLLPHTDAEQALQDTWRLQISEWGVREFANHALYRLMSRPTLRPGQKESILGKTYEEACQYPSLAFRFGNDWHAYGYSRPVEHQEDQPIQELSILPVDLSEYPAARVETIRSLGTVAWQHGLHAYITGETLKLSVYDTDGKPRYTDPHIRAYSRVANYKETAYGMMQLADQEPYAGLHQEPFTGDTQFHFAITPWPRTRVRMQPGYFEYLVPGRFTPDDTRAIHFLRDAVDRGLDYTYSDKQHGEIVEVPIHDAIVMRPGNTFVYGRDNKLLNSLGFMVQSPDGVRATNFLEQDCGEIAKELFGDDAEALTVMTQSSEVGLLMVNDNKLEVNPAKFSSFVSTLPPHMRRRFMTNPQDIIAKANQRLSVFYADTMPAVAVARKYEIPN